MKSKLKSSLKASLKQKSSITRRAIKLERSAAARWNGRAAAVSNLSCKRRFAHSFVRIVKLWLPQRGAVPSQLTLGDRVITCWEPLHSGQGRNSTKSFYFYLRQILLYGKYFTEIKSVVSQIFSFLLGFFLYWPSRIFRLP